MSSDLPPGADPRIGTVLRGKYRLDRVIGSGGMAVVYKATHRNHAKLAVKMLHPELSNREDIRARFLREGYAANAVQHPGAVLVVDEDVTEDGAAFLVMELLDGMSCEQLWHAMGKRVPVELASAIVIQVLDVLAAAHAKGIIHRDIKPANLFVTRAGVVKVLDFGIARAREAVSGAHTTGTGMGLGTPAFASPEQARGRAQEMDGRTDLWAVGATFFAMVSGELVHAGETSNEILIAAATKGARSLGEVAPEVAAGVVEVIDRALAFAKGDRWASAGEMRGALVEAGGTGVEGGDGERVIAAAVGAHVPLEEAPGPSVSPVAETRTSGGEVPARVPTEKLSTSGTIGREPAARRHGVKWVFAAAAAMAALGGIAGSAALRGRSREVGQLGGVAEPQAALARSDIRLACPIFEARGVSDVSGWLGAAAASLACMRAQWYVGGRDDQLLPPARLLDAPTEPRNDFSDEYTDPEQRARTLERARARADAYLDGVVTHQNSGWIVAITLRASDGREVATDEGHDDTSLTLAVKRATEHLWRNPLLARHPVDPEVAYWMGLSDTESGLAFADLTQDIAPEACATVRRRVGDLGNVLYRLALSCYQIDPSNGVDAGPWVVDESSPRSLALTAPYLPSLGAPLSAGEERRIATKLEQSASQERSTLARSVLANAAGTLWYFAGDADRAHAAYLMAAREDPLLVGPWGGLALAADDTGSERSAARSVAAAWFPWTQMFFLKAGSIRGDELDARLRDTQLFHYIDPDFFTAEALGRALAEAGREEEARTVAAEMIPRPRLRPALQSYVLAFIDLHNAKLKRAADRLQEDDKRDRLDDLVVLAAVLGRSSEIATRWATGFLARPDDDVSDDVRSDHGPISVCMYARSDVGTRCLARVSRLGHTSHNWWGEEGEAFLQGAQRYAVGDIQGAVHLWRPLVAGPNENIVRVLPTEAFERAGEPDLAARLDTRKMHYTFIAGVSEAAPREAKRAMAGKDKTRARALAQKVVSAWAVADVPVPAVGEMRALLKTLER